MNRAGREAGDTASVPMGIEVASSAPRISASIVFISMFHASWRKEPLSGFEHGYGLLAAELQRLIYTVSAERLRVPSFRYDL